MLRDLGGTIRTRCEHLGQSFLSIRGRAHAGLRKRLAGIASLTSSVRTNVESKLHATRRRTFERLEPRWVLDSTMVFNEIMYNPNGSDDAALEWIELYNQLAIDIDVSEWSIQGGVDYQFPEGTVLPGREYLVVAIDPAALEAASGFADALGPFTGRLANGGEELRIVNNDGRTMSVIDYGDNGEWPVGPDGGGVSLAKRDPSTSSELPQNWTSSIVAGGTPGAMNFPSATSPSQPIALSEVAPASADDFWLEIVNLGTQSVDLSGVELAATGTSGGQYTFPAQTIDPGEYLQVTEAQLGFHPGDGEKLFVYAPGGQEELLDARVVTNRLRGRSEELGGAWLYPDAATPGAANTFQLQDDIVINEIMYHAFPDLASPGTPATFDRTTLLEIDQDTLWRYNPTGDFLPANWAQSTHAVDGVDWFEGPALIGYDTTPGAVAGTIRTTLDPPQSNDPYIITYYFETEFEFDGDVSQIDGLELGHVIDDGAVFYLNGVELVDARFGMNLGSVNAGTTASSSVGNAAYTGPINIPKDLLLEGTNRLSVEVHQTNTNSSDIIFGAELFSRLQVSEPIPGQSYAESDEEWIELYNRGAATVDLSGWSLDDAVDFQFPAGTELAPGEYLVVARDAAALQAKYPTIEIVGDFSGRLSDREDRILLIDANKNPADEVHYYESGRWSLYADGGGSSLELRDPDADNNRAEAWAASDESTKSTWQTYTYRDVSFEPLLVGANLQQFILGLLDEGELLLDDVSVRRDPDGANQEVIVNGSFEGDAVGATPAGWRLVGNHSSGSVQLDDGNKVLHFIAEGAQQHIHDHVTVDFGNGESIQDGQVYEISLRAKWLAGSAQLNNRFYFTRMANTFVLDVPENNGTPGAENSRFEANVGPTYSDLVQHPVLPAAGQPVTISVRADDPDGIDQIDLKYAVQEGAFLTLPMTLGDDGLYQATIPGQSAGRNVQFYVQGEDALGAASTFPAAGADSRALYIVGAGAATNGSVDGVRIVMLNSDQNDLSVRYNEMSNMYYGATIVHSMDSPSGPIHVAYHDVEVRQVGSRFVRPNSGYKIRLRPDQKFYGVHDSIRLDMSRTHEIYMKHMVARAGGSSVSMYDDVVTMFDPRHGARTVLLQLARYEDEFLREQFVDGNEGTKWELDDIVIPTQPVPLGYNNDQAIQNQDIYYRGPNPEFYRGHLLIKNHRYEDNYQAIVDFAWAINRTDPQELYDATNTVMDVDLWMRHYATQSFLGNWDTYGFRRPKNLRIYVRPEDGKIIPLFWDADQGNLSEPLIYNGDVSRLDDIRDIPQNLRLFWGHMWDLTNRSFNSEYMAPWLAYYNQLGVGATSVGQLSSRTDEARLEARLAIPPLGFQITTNGGAGFAVDQPGATLQGQGWIDVRTIRLAGHDEPLEVTWTGIDTWEVDVPLVPGVNQVTLQAYDFESALIGSDTISITSTVSDRPVQDYLRITELNYHPADPTLEEETAGFADDDDFEFLELFNSGPVTLDLGGVQFTDGIEFAFPAGAQLEPGEFLVLAANPDGVQARYGLEVDVAGQYQGNLRNSGEQLVLADPFAAAILDFTFGDSDATGWPNRADGQGSSLEMIDLEGDYNDPANWRASAAYGGTPGTTALEQVDVIVNEVLAHTDVPDVDAIELYNSSNSPIDLSGWWLSDSSDDLFKYQFAPGSTLDVGSYLLLDENDFNPGEGANPTDFALSSSGDGVWLLEVDPQGNPVRFADVVSFDATLNGVTLGRVPNGSATYRLFPLASPSLGSANGGHRQGEIVVSEVHYHAAAPQPGDSITQAQLDFVELANASNQPVVLHDAALGGWRLRGNADFYFDALPVGTSLAAGEVLVLVSFDPNDATLASEFRSNHGIDANVALMGPYTGSLGDDGGVVRLLAPTEPPLGEVDPVYYLVDRTSYEDAAPWPTSPDGLGDSLSRIAAEPFGDFASSWQAAAPSPGVAFSGFNLPSDFDADGDVDGEDLARWETGFGTTAGATVGDGDADADGDVDGADFLAWQRYHGIAASASNSVGFLAAADVAAAGEVDEVVPAPAAFDTKALFAPRSRGERQGFSPSLRHEVVDQALNAFVAERVDRAAVDRELTLSLDDVGQDDDVSAEVEVDLNWRASQLAGIVDSLWSR